MMVDREENLERQLEELEALKSILGDHCVEVSEKDNGSRSVNLLSHSPDATLSASLQLILPSNYPSHGPPSNFKVVTEVPGFPHCTHIFSKIGANANGEVCLYDMILLLNERLADIEDDTKHAKEEELKIQEQIEKLKIQQEEEELYIMQQQQSVKISYRPTKFGRRCIYSHHIIASNKRTAILRAALQLGLSGLSKIGWPGVIVVEGDELACQEYVRYLSSMRWKQLIVRGEEVIDIHENQTIDSMRKFPPGMTEFGSSDMKDAAAACREAGLEDLFKTSMKIYK